MPDINFQCPNCSGTLDVPAEMANQLMECPACKETIEVPARNRTPLQQFDKQKEILRQKPIEVGKSEEVQNAIRDAEGRAIIQVFRVLFELAVIAVIFWWIFLKPSQSILTTSENLSQPKTQTFPVNDASTPISPPKVSISNLNGEIQDYGGMDITGIIHNLSGATLHGVTVNFTFLDDDGNKVDDAMDFIQTLTTDDTWNFKVSSLKDNCKKYRLDSITSYIDNSEVNLDVQQMQ